MRTKKLILSTLLFGIGSLFTACAKDSKPQPSTLNKNRTSSCQEEIRATVSALIEAQNLTVSEDVFSQVSILELNNQRADIFGHREIINDQSGRKRLLLYREEGDLYIGLINQKEEVLKSKKLQKCH